MSASGQEVVVRGPHEAEAVLLGGGEGMAGSL